MPRGKRPDTALRNAQIYAEWTRKPDLPGLAAKYELTPQRIGQIVATFNPDLETEHERAMLKGGLWNLVHEIQEVIDAPGYKLAPNGHLATDDDGNPVPDIMAKIEGIKVKGIAYKQIAQLVGAEKQLPPRPSMATEAAMVAARASIDALAEAKAAREREIEERHRRELEELRRAAARPPVVPGQVVGRELEPPAGT